LALFGSIPRFFAVAPQTPYGNTFPMPFDAWVSILVMPVGVMICFGPALLIWVAQERKDASETPADKK
jgi:hypothetical protein